MKLQLFADGGSGEGGTPQDKGGSTTAGGTNPGNASGGEPGQAFDYDKLASIISGKQTVAEDTVLKKYFQGKGLSREEADKAIAAFKEQKKANEPNVEELQSGMKEARKMALDATLEKYGTLISVELGIDAKTIPYVLKMADMGAAAKEDGSVDQEKLKEIISKVIEDVPGLKPDAQAHGFRKVGSDGGDEDVKSGALASAFGNAKNDK